VRRHLQRAGRATRCSGRFARCRATSAGPPTAVAFTSYTGPEHRASVLRAGFQLHVEKPIGLDALIGAVATFALKDHAR
jgi:CheY-like chemotaxis protein